mgnify:CR=1 FL=1
MRELSAQPKPTVIALKPRVACGVRGTCTTASGRARCGAAGTSRRTGAAPATRPPLLFKEESEAAAVHGELNDENRRARRDAVTNPALELKPGTAPEHPKQRRRVQPRVAGLDV